MQHRPDRPQAGVLSHPGGEVTAERVKEHFAGVCLGRVERFELPNLDALNFLLHDSLDGGGTVSLRADPQGKTFSTALLRMEIEI